MRWEAMMDSLQCSCWQWRSADALTILQLIIIIIFIRVGAHPSSTTVSAADETLESSQWQWHVVVSCLLPSRTAAGMMRMKRTMRWDTELSLASLSLAARWMDGGKSSELMFNKWLPSRTKTLIKNFSHNYFALQEEEAIGDKVTTHIHIQQPPSEFRGQLNNLRHQRSVNRTCYY